MVAVTAQPPVQVADDELSLVIAAQGGDLNAFEELVRRYEMKILRLAEHITGNAEDAQDVLQDTFLKAYSKLDQFQRNSRFYTWLVRIAVNESLMRLRKRRGDKTVSIDQDIETEEDVVPRQIADWHPNPEQQYATEQMRDILGRTIASLPLAYRSVFQLRDVEGLSTEETADLLHISIPAVKSRLLRARLQLREKLSNYFRKQPEGVQP
jgi:RNA polymerase sigma-70 factor (ECF subfamily)